MLLTTNVIYKVTDNAVNKETYHNTIFDNTIGKECYLVRLLNYILTNLKLI